MSINANKRRTRAKDGPPEYPDKCILPAGWLGSAADTDALVRRARGEVPVTPQMIRDMAADLPHDEQRKLVRALMANWTTAECLWMVDEIRLTMM
jgi:hypothetical protein